MGKKRGDMERATRSEQKEERLKRDRGRFSREYWYVIYSRPKVMLLAAEGSATRGREQHELRPRVDDFSYGWGENGASLPWESDKIAKFVEEKVMAEGQALKIEGCFYAVLGQPTCDGGLRRSTVAHFARKVRGTNIATAKH